MKLFYYISFPCREERQVTIKFGFKKLAFYSSWRLIIMFRQRILHFSQNLIDKNNFWCSNQSLRQFQEPVRKKFNVSHFITNINTSFLYVSFLSSHVIRLNNVSKETRKKKRKEENPSSIITANCNDKGKRKKESDFLSPYNSPILIRWPKQNP